MTVRNQGPIYGRRRLIATWVALNPKLPEGFIGQEVETGKTKIGDGVTRWNSLSYQGGQSVVSGVGLFVFPFNIDTANIKNPAIGAVTGIVVPGGSYCEIGLRITENFDDSDDRILGSDRADFPNGNFVGFGSSGLVADAAANNAGTAIDLADEKFGNLSTYWFEDDMNLRVAVLKYDVTAGGSITGAGVLIVRISTPT